MPEPTSAPPEAEAPPRSRLAAALLENVAELVLLVGLGFLGVGLSLAWPPAGPIAVGAVLVAVSILMLRPWAS